MGPQTDPSPARARRTGSTRDALIESGLDCFAEVGYAHARLADITKSAGLTTGAFYRHFTSKEDFYDALLAAYGDALQAELNNAATLLDQCVAWIKVSRAYRGVVRASAEIALPDTAAAKSRRQLRDACASLLARNLQGMSSWRLTHGSAVMLIDALDQHVLMEAAGWIPVRPPERIATALDRLVQQGLYKR